MVRPMLIGVVIVTGIVVIAVIWFFFPKPQISTISQTTTTTSPAIPATDAGLLIYDPVVGNGLEVDSDNGLQLKLIYTGSYDDGTVFDSSHGQQPYLFTFGSSDAPLGWNQGLLGMKVGGTRVLTIYPDFVGRAQYTSKLPADKTVIYTVRLISITEVHADGPMLPPPGTPQVQLGI